MARAFFSAFQMLVARKFVDICPGFVLVLLDNLWEEVIGNLDVRRCSATICSRLAFRVSVKRQNQSGLEEDLSISWSEHTLIYAEAPFVGKGIVRILL